MATRADVARLAGVSSSTVTYALYGDRPVSDDTRQRVLQAARELGYTPNAAAKALASRSLHTVGIHFTMGRESLSTSDLDYVDGLGAYLQERGTSLVLPTPRQADQDYLGRLAASGAVNAMVLMDVAEDDPRELLLLEHKLPTVLIGRSGRKNAAPYVDADFDDMSRRATNYLHQLGHRRILCLLRDETSEIQKTHSRALLYDAVRDCYQRLDLEGEIVWCPVSFETGVYYASQVGVAGGYTAVMGDNSLALEALWLACRLQGRQCPRDYSILSLTQIVNPGSTAGQAFTECSPDRVLMGRRAGELLVAMHRNRAFAPFTPTDNLLPGVLTERSSCARVASVPAS